MEKPDLKGDEKEAYCLACEKKTLWKRNGPTYCCSGGCYSETDAELM